MTVDRVRVGPPLPIVPVMLRGETSVSGKSETMLPLATVAFT